MIFLTGFLTFQSVGQVKHHFSYIAPNPVKSVSIAGTFNSWNKEANPMVLEADGRTWSIDLLINYGKHQYKFVADGSNWIVDPLAKSEDDGNGNLNSILNLPPPDFKNEA